MWYTRGWRRGVYKEIINLSLCFSNLLVYKCALEKETFFVGDKNCVKIAFQRYNDSNYFFVLDISIMIDVQLTTIFYMLKMLFTTKAHPQNI